jgi:hypothetical protein
LVGAGDIDRAMQHAQISVAISTLVDAPPTRAVALMCRGTLHKRLSQWELALEDLREAATWFRAASDCPLRLLIRIESSIQACLHGLGRVDDARELQFELELLRGAFPQPEDHMTSDKQLGNPFDNDTVGTR